MHNNLLCIKNKPTGLCEAHVEPLLEQLLLPPQLTAGQEVEGKGAQVPPHQRQVAALGGGRRSGPASCPAPAPRVRLRRNKGAEVAPRVAQGYRRSGTKKFFVMSKGKKNQGMCFLKLHIFKVQSRAFGLFSDSNWSPRISVFWIRICIDLH